QVVFFEKITQKISTFKPLPIFILSVLSSLPKARLSKNKIFIVFRFSSVTDKTTQNKKDTREVSRIFYSANAPDAGSVKSMNIRLVKIDDQRNKSCEGCNYYSCIRVFWRICLGKCMISNISCRCPWKYRPVLRTPSHYIY